jgi:UDP-N-acetyl-D-mannosaminuronate dehydrogenase
VVLESTTYPGTTRERVLPILEESGLAAGRDFHLAFSPERVDPGRTDFTLRNTPKALGVSQDLCRYERKRSSCLLLRESRITSRLSRAWGFPPLAWSGASP